MIMSFFNFFKKTQPKNSSHKETLTTLQDLIAPAGLEISPNNLKWEKNTAPLFLF